MILIIELIILIIVTLTISVFSFLQKGPLISVIYYMSSKKEREERKTKKRYYFSGTIYLVSAILFGIILVEELFDLPSMQKPIIVISIILSIYFITRYTQIESERMKSKKSKN